MQPGSDPYVHDLLAVIGEQRRHIERLEATIASLREELASRGDTPGGPSGSVGSSAPRKAPHFVKGNRQEKKKRPRKQREQGYSRKREAAHREVVHDPERCSCCGRALSGGWVHDRRQVIDIPYVPYEVVDHVVMARHCGVCRRDEVARPDLCGIVIGKSRFGVRLTAPLPHLSVDCRMPVRTIRRHLWAAHGLEVSSGAVVEMLHRAARLGRELYAELRERLLSSPYINADETGWREDGVNGYVWSFSSGAVRYYLRNRSRGSHVVAEMLGDSRKPLVSDFYSAYHFYPGEHQYCWAHVFTEMRKLQADHPDNEDLRRWCERIGLLYRNAVAWQHQNPLCREDEREAFEIALLDIVTPYIHTGMPHDVLAQRLARRVRGMFVFVQYPEVPPTNNAAERAIRPLVTKRKVCGGTRSERGSETLAILASLFETWRIRNEVGLQQCARMLTGNLIRAPT